MELSDLKIMLGLSDDNTKSDSLLSLIIKNTELSLRFKLGLKAEEELPSELSYIPLEVAIRRFNRLKNEGMTSYSQEGESITFNSSDFADFVDDINEWRRQHQKDTKSLGHVAFINPYGGDSGAAR